MNLSPKLRTKVNSSILEKNDFLNRFIVQNPTDKKKIRCTICEKKKKEDRKNSEERNEDEDWFLYENLKRHLEGSDHKKAAARAGILELSEAGLLYLREQKTLSESPSIEEYKAAPTSGSISESRQQTNKKQTQLTTSDTQFRHS